MNRIKVLLLAGVILTGLGNALAQSPDVRVRGAIINFDGHVLEVKTREGKDLKVGITNDTRVSVLSALDISDIKQGSFVGVTAIRKGPERRMYALEVHVFPEDLRGMGEGHRDWDLEPGSTMTNANVDAIVERNDGKELTLGYKGGQQQIVVTPDTPVVTFAPADKSLLKAGAQVFFVARPGADGTLIAQRIQVGKDGLTPPM